MFLSTLVFAIKNLRAFTRKCYNILRLSSRHFVFLRLSINIRLSPDLLCHPHQAESINFKPLNMVGVPGFEPGTSSLSGTRSNQLSYTPFPQKMPQLSPTGLGCFSLREKFRLFPGAPLYGVPCGCRRTRTGEVCCFRRVVARPCGALTVRQLAAGS